MIRRDFNHPSLIIWTIVNEDWGTALPLSAADRALGGARCTHAARHWTRRAWWSIIRPARTRWGPNIHVHSDLDDFHIYANIPDQARSLGALVGQFNLRPLWTFPAMATPQRTGQEPLILSEFGNWGLPSLADAARGSTAARPGLVRHRPLVVAVGGRSRAGRRASKSGSSGWASNAIWGDYEALRHGHPVAPVRGA